MSSPSATRELIHRARALLAQGRAVLDAEADGHTQGEAPPTDLLGLYDALRGRLGTIDEREIEELLAAVSQTVDQLGSLADDLDRVKSLRSALTPPAGS